MRAYEYRHVVSFEETNLVGNVYYANHVRWQGRCREMFLHDHAPAVLEGLAHGFALVTTRVSCEYLAELNAFDELIIQMRLGPIKQNRIDMLFEYWRCKSGARELVARGEQQVACMQREGKEMVPIPVPRELRDALKPYSESELTVGPGQYRNAVASG
ncbi:MAG TPA: acyl-CoA thioesterase [Pyrinomonadaceae bacterium]